MVLNCGEYLMLCALNSATKSLSSFWYALLSSGASSEAATRVIPMSSVSIAERIAFPMFSHESKPITTHRVQGARHFVGSLVDHPHATTAQFFNDAVVRDSLPDHWAQILGPEVRQVNEGAGVGYVPASQLAKHPDFTHRPSRPVALFRSGPLQSFTFQSNNSIAQLFAGRGVDTLAPARANYGVACQTGLFKLTE